MNHPRHAFILQWLWQHSTGLFVAKDLVDSLKAAGFRQTTLLRVFGLLRELDAAGVVSHKKLCVKYRCHDRLIRRKPVNFWRVVCLPAGASSSATSIEVPP